MKFGFTIANGIFKKAERLARRLGISRSQLDSEAVDDYSKRRSPESITDAMNRVVEKVGTVEDELVPAAARRILAKTRW